MRPYRVVKTFSNSEPQNLNHEEPIETPKERGSLDLPHTSSAYIPTPSFESVFKARCGCQKLLALGKSPKRATTVKPFDIFVHEHYYQATLGTLRPWASVTRSGSPPSSRQGSTQSKEKRPATPTQILRPVPLAGSYKSTSTKRYQSSPAA